jgi:hypothetical protein
MLRQTFPRRESRHGGGAASPDRCLDRRLRVCPSTLLPIDAETERRIDAPVEIEAVLSIHDHVLLSVPGLGVVLPLPAFHDQDLTVPELGHALLHAVLEIPQEVILCPVMDVSLRLRGELPSPHLLVCGIELFSRNGETLVPAETDLRQGSGVEVRLHTLIGIPVLLQDHAVRLLEIERLQWMGAYRVISRRSAG